MVTDLSGATVSDDIPTVTIIPEACFDAIAITKSGVFNDVDTSGCTSLGVDTVTYTFTVTNQGNTPLTSVTVTDPLLGGLLTATVSGDANNNTILEVTETWVYVQDYVVTQSDIDTGSITNQATASGTGAEGVVTDLSGATISDDIPTVTIIPEACLDTIAITKTGVFNDVDTNGCSTASVDTVTYTFTVTNQGNTPLTSVTVTDPLLGGLLAAVPSGDTNNNTILDITETWVYVQDYVVTQSDIDTGSITNQATASGTGAEGVVTDLSGATISDDIPTVTIVPASCLDAIAITKTGVFNDIDTNGCSTASIDTVTYTFTVTSQGNTPLTGVTVTDPLLGGLLTAVPSGDTNNNTILDITETWVYVQDYVVTQSDIDTGSITNQATASGTGVNGLVTDLSGATISDDIPTVTIIPEACLDTIAITKTGVFNDIDTNGCSTASIDTVTYTFTVTNQGNTPLTSVTVTDPLLGGLLAAVPSGDTNNNTILDITETWVYVQDYVVTQSDIDTGSITNQATASGTGAEGVVTDLSGATVSDDTPTVTIVPASCLDAIAITKTGVFNDIDANGCTSLAVDTVTYTFTVTNQGNTPLTSVTVTDPLLGGLLAAVPSGDTNNNTILDITETWVYVQDYVVTQSDIDTGSITNQATASGTGAEGVVTDLSGATISDDIPTVTIIPEACLDAIAITKSGVFNDIDTNGCSTASIDTVTYTFTVTNAGNTPLSSVTVTDPLLGGLLAAVPSGDTNNNTILDITETWVYVQDYVVTQSDIDTGSITNQATASGTGINGLVTDVSGATVSDDTPTVTIVPASCLDAIAITKTGVFNDIDANGCTSLAVDTVTYTFTVTNQGNTPLTSVTVTDPLLGGLLTAIPSGDTNNNTILEVTETWVYVQDYVVTQSDIDTGSITNQATASGTGVNGIVSDVSGATVSDDIPTVTIIPEACFDAIAITKAGVFNDVDTNGCSTASVDTVTYTFTVTNAGNTPLTSVTVTDPLLGGLLTAIPSGDTNNNTILDITETWVYVQDYVVTQSDIDTGSITNQATATGEGVEGIVTDVSGDTITDDTPTVTILPEACIDAIALTKTGVFNDVDTSGCSTASVDTVTYTFTVTSQGNTPLTGVTVTDPLLGGLLTAVPSGDTNNNTILDITETWVYVQDYVVTQSDIDTGSITNQATASGTGAEGVVTDLSGATISDDIPTVTIVPASCLDAIAITKTGVFNDVDTSGCTSLGVDTVTYTFTVTNQGNTPLTSVTVTDPLLGGLLAAVPSGDTNNNTILDITETWVYVQDYVVTQSDIDTGSITNQATASGTGINGLVTDLSGATISDDIPTVTIIPEACFDAIAITKSGVFNDVDTSGCTSLGVDTVTYTFTVTNQGNTPLTSVTVTDPLLGGLLAAVPSGDTNNNTILDITETWVYVQDYVVTQSDIDTGSITNQATASGTGAEGVVTDLSGATVSDDTPTVTIVPASCLDAIAITKTGVFNDIDANGCTSLAVDTVTYTFTVTNQGNTPLTSVTVTDPLLGGLLAAVPSGDTNNNTILDITETWVYVQDYVVTQSDIDTGSITNQATASGTGVNGLVTDLSGATVSDDTPTVTIVPASCLDAIAITKTGVFNDIDANGCTSLAVDTVTYTFTVTNQGNTPLTSVTVTDPLLGGLLAAVPSGDTNNNTILDITETWVYVQDYVVTQSDIDTGSITNQATASGTGINGLVTDVSGATVSDDTPTVTIVPASCLDAIAITKTGVFNDIDANGCTSLAVDTVTYTFTVTNQGNTPLTSVTVTDPLLGGLLTATPTGDTNNNTILEVTETWVYVQDYVVTQSDIDTGSITNQATASGTGVNGIVSDVSGATVSDDIPTVTIIPEACFDAIAITKAGVFNDVDTNGCSTASVDTVTYTFTVTNAGNTPLTSVTVTDPLLGGLLTATPTGDTNNNTILDITETWVYVQDYVVTQSDIDTGSITNQATASGTGVNGIVSDVSGATVSDDIPTVTIIPEACFDAIAITKAGVFNDVDTNGCSTASVDTVTYTFTVTNAGNTPLTSVTVTDPLLGGLLTAIPSGDTNNNTILDITETWVYVQDYVVTQSDIDTGSITNQATATGEGVEGIVTDVSGATVSDDIPTVTIIPEACFDAIAITKAGVFNDVDTNGCSTASVDTVTYTFTVTNAGNTPLTSVTVTDPLLGGLLTAIPSGDTNNNTILDITETWVYVQDYVVTQSDIDTGSITNQATATGEGVEGIVTDVSGDTITDDTPTVTILPEACIDAIALTKTGVFNDVDTSGCTSLGVDTVTYTFTVTSQGNTPLTGVTVTDPLLGGLLTAVPSGDTNNNTILDITETWVYVQDYVVTQSDIDTGSITNQATASGTGVNGLVTDVSGATVSDDIPTVTIIPEACFDAIAITKTGVFNDVDTSGCTSLGVDTVTYTFTVTNQGNTPLTSVTVTDPLLGGLLTATVSGDANNNTILEVTETWVYVQDYVVTQSDIDTGSITNQATASGTGAEGVVTDLSGATISDDIPTVTIIPEACLDTIAITKTGVFNDVDTNGCSTASVDTVTYTFTVTNQGNTPLTSVTVTDPLLGGLLAAVPSGDTNNNTILDITETWVYVQDYVVTQSDIDTGSITNQATASGTGAEGVVTDLSGATVSDDIPTVTIIPEACFDAIAITKAGVFNDVDTNGCSTASVDTVTYTFTVTNAGNTPLTSVTVTDPLLGGLLTAVPTGDANNNTILEVTETWVYVQDYVVTQSDIDTGSITNQATASGTGVNGVVTDLSGATVSDDIPTVTIIPEACFDAIAITKAGVFNDIDTNGCTSLGVDTVTYTFTVTNQGNTPLTSVTVTDPLLGGLLAAVLSGDANNNTILEVTETWVYVQDYVVTQSDIDTGSITNQATASGTGVNGLVTDLSGATISDDIPTVTIIPEACFDAIAITKTGVFNDVDTSGCTSLGVDTVTYTFTVTNQGNTPLTSVTVTDPLLGGLLTAVPSGDTNNNTILDITETWVYVQDYVVTQSDIDTGSITNQATASGTGVNGLVTDLSGATVSDDIPTVTIIPEACFDAIAITKSGVFNDVDTSGCTSLGVDTVTYTFTVTNQGNTPLTSVTVTDPLLGGLLTATPTGDTNNNTILEVTETWVYVQDYVVTQSDIDTGSITNQATASGTGVNGLVTDLSGATISDDIPTVTIIPEACLDAIAITKAGVFNDVDTSGCTTAGIDTVTYTFTVTNGGNTPLSSVSVTDPLLGGLLTATPSGDTNTNGILDITETWVYVQDYSVTQSDIDTGSITNQATATGEGVEGIVTDLSGDTITDDTPTVTILQEACIDAIALTKTGVFNDVDTSGCTTAGIDTVTYTFTVTNGGNTPLSSVSVTDPLLGGLLTATPSGDTNTNGILDITETWVYVQDYSVTQSDIDTGSITNQATATGEGVEGIVTDLSGDTITDDTPTVTILQEACIDAIALTKTGVFNDVDTSGCTTAGIDTVTYTFTVTNGGNTPLSSVSVTDPLLGGLLTATPSGDTNTNGVLDITETWVYVQDYSVTQSDIDTGSITNQATATGEGVEGIVTDVSGDTITDDTPTVTILPEACIDAIALTKTGVFNDVDTNGCSTASVDTVTYTFTVTNQGNTPLTSVTVTDPLLGGLLTAVPSGDTNNNTILDITETWVYVQDYVVTQSDIDTGSITNQATATGEGVEGIVTDVSGDTITDDTPTVTVVCQEAGISLVMISEILFAPPLLESSCGDIGEEISLAYTYVVTNEGNVSATDIILDHPLVGGIVAGPISGDDNGNNILDIPEIWTYNAIYNITQVDFDLGFISSQATVVGNAGGIIVTDISDDNTPLEDDPTVTVFDGCISLIKTAIYDAFDPLGNCISEAGQEIEYAFSVKNTGSIPLTNVVVTDPLLTVIGGPITLEAGQEDTTTFTGTYIISQADIIAGIFENQAEVSGTKPLGGIVTDLSDEIDYTQDNPTITLLCQEDAIAITKAGVFNDVDTSGCATALVDTVTYTFTVTNGGNTPLSSVSVTDPLLGGLLTAIPTGDTNTNGVLDVTETWVYVQDYVVTQSDIDTGSITNQATASGTGVNGLVTDLSGATISDDIPTVTIIPEACLDTIAITKTGVFNDIDTNGCSTASIDTVTYTFTVTNQGNTPLTSVTVTDPLLGGLLAAVPSGDTNNNTILDITETWVYVQDYVVTQSDIDTGSITNQATASGTGAEGLVTDLSGATISDDIPTVTIVPASCLDAIAITKTGVFNDVDTNGCTSLGVDTVTYTFTRRHHYFFCYLFDYSSRY